MKRMRILPVVLMLGAGLFFASCTNTSTCNQEEAAAPAETEAVAAPTEAAEECPGDSTCTKECEKEGESGCSKHSEGATTEETAE